MQPCSKVTLLFFSAVPNIPPALNTPQQRGPNNRVSMREYSAYHLMQRSYETPPLHMGGRLFQEWLVDTYARIETNNMNFHRDNQALLRADLYSNTTLQVGHRILLPSSFVGGPRYMQQQYQDAMAIVRARGTPDLFVTMTCNADWPEILNALLPGQTANDRPDIVARVFGLKLQMMLHDLRTAFGRSVGLMAAVEWQKRGLPHAHILHGVSRYQPTFILN